MHIETLPVKVAGDPFFTVNCYLISDTAASDCVVAIDPGDQAEVILKQIATRTLAAIILTHGHYDHLGAVTELVEATGAKLYIHQDEVANVEEGYEAVRKGFFRFLKFVNPETNSYDNPAATRAPGVAETLTEGELLELCGLKLRVMHTPGHSKGSLCLYASDEGVLFSGDTLFKGTCGRTDLGGSPAQMHDTLARLATLPPRTVVYPGHEGTTTIGEELQRGLSEY